MFAVFDGRGEDVPVGDYAPPYACDAQCLERRSVTGDVPDCTLGMTVTCSPGFRVTFVERTKGAITVQSAKGDDAQSISVPDDVSITFVPRLSGPASAPGLCAASL